MNITEARERCNELREEISRIRKYFDSGSFAKHMGSLESQPLEEYLDCLMMAIIKADETTEIDFVEDLEEFKKKCKIKQENNAKEALRKRAERWIKNDPKTAEGGKRKGKNNEPTN